MSGSLVVITGPMFAGKTKKLIEYYYDLKKVNKKVLVFKPAIDKRYSQTEVVSHDGEKIPAIAVQNIEEIAQILDKETDAILIDEVQLFFFETATVNFLDDLAKAGKEIILSGLDWNNFENKPISRVAGLLAAADKVIKLTGICDVCGNKATRTQWKLDYLPESRSDYVGGAEKYTCRCRLHFTTKLFKKVESEDLEKQVNVAHHQLSVLAENQAQVIQPTSLPPKNDKK